MATSQRDRLELQQRNKCERWCTSLWQFNALIPYDVRWVGQCDLDDFNGCALNLYAECQCLVASYESLKSVFEKQSILYTML